MVQGWITETLVSPAAVVSAILRSCPSDTCSLRHMPKVKKTEVGYLWFSGEQTDYTFLVCLQSHTTLTPALLSSFTNEGAFSSLSSAPPPLPPDPRFCRGGNNSCWCLSQRKVAETGTSHVRIESREGSLSVQVAFSRCVSSCE